MLHAEKLLNLLTGQAARATANGLKHLLAHGVELVAHAFGCLLAGVDAVVRCRRMIEKWQVAGVHKKKAPKGLGLGQEGRKVDLDAVLVIDDEVAHVILEVVGDALVGFGFLGCHQVGQGLADDKRAVETLQGSHVKKAMEQCLSASTHCLGVARPSSLSCR